LIGRSLANIVNEKNDGGDGDDDNDDGGGGGGGEDRVDGWHEDTCRIDGIFAVEKSND
jgi:hypothetical protein